MANIFPKFPFDGQIIIDAYGVQWQYDVETETWSRLGAPEDIPDASGTQTGLLSPVLKTKIDGIPAKGGGSAIIIKPLKRSLDNTDGIIVGDVELVSNSLDITCTDANGDPMPSGAGCVVNIEVPEGIEDLRQPGFNFQIKDKTYNSICVRVPGIAGPRGDKGAKGIRGEPGTGDGPQGDKGAAGKSQTVAGTFTGVKIVEASGIYDSAIVGLDLDAEQGILTAIKSKVRIPTDDKPAEQVVAAAIVRGIQFTSGWSFNVTKPSEDALDTLDPNILHLPPGFVPAAGKSAEVSVKKFSYIVGKIVDKYKADLEKIEAEYDTQLRDYILAIDAEARKILADLAQKLADCEWQLPIDFCLGIDPDECGATIGIPGLAEGLDSLAGRLGDAEADVTGTTFGATATGLDWLNTWSIMYLTPISAGGSNRNGGSYRRYDGNHYELQRGGRRIPDTIGLSSLKVNVVGTNTSAVDVEFLIRGSYTAPTSGNSIMSFFDIDSFIVAAGDSSVPYTADLTSFLPSAAAGAIWVAVIGKDDATTPFVAPAINDGETACCSVQSFTTG